MALISTSALWETARAFLTIAPHPWHQLPSVIWSAQSATALKLRETGIYPLAALYCF